MTNIYYEFTTDSQGDRNEKKTGQHLTNLCAREQLHSHQLCKSHCLNALTMTVLTYTNMFRNQEESLL